MSKTVSRILWVVAGVLLMADGVICLAWPGVALTTLAVFLGIVMLISGAVDIVIFAKGHTYMHGSGWFLADGILTVILALFILFNQAFTMLTLPFIFGMWLLFSGISKIVNSFDLKMIGVRGWGWFLALGILFVVGGFLSFLDPVAGALTLGAVTGVILILQGIGSILRAFFSGRFLM